MKEFIVTASQKQQGYHQVGKDKNLFCKTAENAFWHTIKILVGSYKRTVTKDILSRLLTEKRDGKLRMLT